MRTRTNPSVNFAGSASFGASLAGTAALSSGRGTAAERVAGAIARASSSIETRDTRHETRDQMQAGPVKLSRVSCLVSRVLKRMTAASFDERSGVQLTARGGNGLDG